MSPTSFQYPSILKLFCFALILPNIIALPTPAQKSLYDVSIHFLQANNCQMPKEIYLPFKTSSGDATSFDYLADPLKECQIPEAVKEDIQEAHMLCKEIFEILQNITCSQFNVSLPPIKSNVLSGEVCKTFIAMRDILPSPKRDKYISGKLVDSVICELLCTKRFKSLCQTLLWSHDVRAQIENVTEIYGNMDGTPQLEPLLAEDNKNEKEEKLKSHNILNNNLDAISKISVISSLPSKTDIDVTTQKTATKISKLTSPVQNGISVMGINAVDQLQAGDGIQVGNLDKAKDVKKEMSKPGDNKVSDNAKSEKNKAFNQPSKSIVKEKHVAVVTESNKGITSGTTQDVESSTTVNSDKTNANAIPVSPIHANNPEDNELDGGSFQEEQEGVKETNMQIPDTPDKKTEKPKEKETDLEMSNKVSIDTNLKLETTTFQTNPEDDDREQDINDTENEEYAMSEFENLNDINMKEQNIKSSVGSEVASPNNDVPDDFDSSQIKNIGHRQEDNPMISTFPEQEDSHFFFYFLSMVLILMAGYLLFHNKQKIIALIVEGRHERRRRSHGAGYKKLDTK